MGSGHIYMLFHLTQNLPRQRACAAAVKELATTWDSRRMLVIGYRVTWDTPCVCVYIYTYIYLYIYPLPSNEDRDRVFLWNVCIYLRMYMALKPRRTPSPLLIHVQNLKTEIKDAQQRSTQCSISHLTLLAFKPVNWPLYWPYCRNITYM
jgi:hypothetical protein